MTSDSGSQTGRHAPLILIVDDHADSLEMCVMLFEQSGFSVVGVSSVGAALELLETERPAVVLTDIAMPEINGWALMELLHEDRFAAIPVVALSGHADADTRARAFDAGASAFYAKPFDPMELVAHVRELSYDQTRYNRRRTTRRVETARE